MITAPPSSSIGDPMSESVIEIMARAVCEVEESDTQFWADYTDHVRAALSAAAERGYVLVPVEPTPAMSEAGGTETINQYENSRYCLNGDVEDALQDLSEAAIYRAMLEKAPKP